MGENDRVTAVRQSLPASPGVYFFKNAAGEIIYVGKAKSLKSRVNSYFARRGRGDPHYQQKLDRLVAEIADIEVLVTNNETEALLLENQKIKQHSPRYNVILRDDKSFPWIMITTSEQYPRIRVIRGPRRFNLADTFIGPFVSSYNIKRLIGDLRKQFPFCTCRSPVPERPRQRPCLDYQLGLCPGPCTRAISPEAYRDSIRVLEKIFRGNVQELLTEFTQAMDAAAADLRFEDAAAWRDRIDALQQMATEQSIVVMAGDALPPQDVIAYAESTKHLAVLILQIRGGRLHGRVPFLINTREMAGETDDFLFAIVEQYYLSPEVDLPERLTHSGLAGDRMALLLEAVKTATGKSLVHGVPPEGSREAGIHKIAQNNAHLILSQQETYEEFQDARSNEGVVQSLQEVLGLPDPPMRIEGFDISNIQGTDPTASAVCFIGGLPAKNEYRRFKIQGAETPNDVGMMRQAMERNYRRALREGGPFPDLILVDGGKPQLNMASVLLRDLGLEIPVIGLAKREEEIFVPGVPDPLVIDPASPALGLLKAVRDESHRFAKAYHTQLRNRRQKKSLLDEIPGVGPARKRKLLQVFGSVAEIEQTPEADLTAVVGPALAAAIREFFVQRAAGQQTGDPSLSRRLKKTKKVRGGD